MLWHCWNLTAQLPRQCCCSLLGLRSSVGVKVDSHTKSHSFRRLCIRRIAYHCHAIFAMIRGVIKKFSAWPSYVQNKIKIVFASYSCKALTQHAQYDFRVNVSCISVVVGYLQSKWKKAELRSVMKWQFWPICSFHCMLCCSDSESKLCIHVLSWITSCDINFCWATSVSFE